MLLGTTITIDLAAGPWQLLGTLFPDGPWEMTVLLFQLLFVYLIGLFAVRVVRLNEQRAVGRLVTAPLRILLLGRQGNDHDNDERLQADGGREAVEDDLPPEPLPPRQNDEPEPPAEARAHQPPAQARAPEPPRNVPWPPSDAFIDEDDPHQ